MREEKQTTAENLAQFCSSIANDRKAENILVLKLDNVSLLADYFVICTANSQPHLNALSEWVRRKVREEFNIRPISIDGTPESEWIVIDFGDVIAHILSEDARNRYQLESLWSDAKRLEQVFTERLNEIK